MIHSPAAEACTVLVKIIFCAIIPLAMNYPYPPSPEIKDERFLHPSESFKQQVYAMIQGIILFALLYLVLIALSIGLLVACFALGVGIIAAKPSFITVAIGAGIIALGVMVFLFLVKFIFARTQESDPQQIEITERDQPRLFDFIRRVTQEVKTDFPKRIFLVPDVNAAVLYNSSFWSMFLPIRKNLRIGLGLVNSLNVSEFKATLAHEFGHFSQRSMKLGSYVYTVNKVIFDLVNHRDRWDHLLERWAGTGGIFGFFAGITFWIANQVRRLLVHAYRHLNIRYMALSREMEYHADYVACSVSGTEPMISTLRKIEFTDAAYQITMNKLNELAGQKKKTNNLYALHHDMTLWLAKQYKIGVAHDSPEITEQDLERNMVKSRLNVKDQWASHPSRDEREKSIRQVSLPVDMNFTPAWVLFDQAAQWKETMTTRLYDLGMPNHTQEMTVIPAVEFYESVEKEEAKNKLPEVFKGFYDNRLLKEFDVAEAGMGKTDRAFEELFSADTREFIQRHNANQYDLDQLKFMLTSMKPNDVFEFDFRKRKASEIPTLITALEKEIHEGNETALSLDKHAFQYFHAHAAAAGEESKLRTQYETLFALQKEIRSLTVMVEKLQAVHQEMATKLQWSEQEVKSLNTQANSLETNFRDFLLARNNDYLETRISKPEEFSGYLKKKEFYMTLGTFNQEGFDLLSGRIFEVYGLLNEQRVELLKKLLELQLKWVPEKLLQAER